MNSFTKLLSSTLSQKIVMSITGLLLISFLLVHLIGNLLLFKGDGGYAFNAYAHFMSTAIIIRVAEIVLILGWVIHINMAWYLTWHNHQVRPQGYCYHRPQANSRWASRHMGLTGSLLLFFLAVHGHNFWFRYHFAVTAEYKNMYLLTKITFQQEWWWSILYLLAMISLSFHLAHGFASAFQTLGLYHKKYTPIIQKIGLLFALVVPASFAAIPCYFLALTWFT